MTNSGHAEDGEPDHSLNGHSRLADCKWACPLDTHQKNLFKQTSTVLNQSHNDEGPSCSWVSVNLHSVSFVWESIESCLH